MAVFSVTKREFVVVVSGFDIAFCHADVSVGESGSCGNSGFVGNISYDTFAIKWAKVLISAIANCGGYIVYISLIAFIQDLLVVVFDDAGHVSQHRTNSTRPIQQEHDLEVSYSCSTYMANIRKKHDQKIRSESRIIGPHPSGCDVMVRVRVRWSVGGSVAEWLGCGT